MYIKHNVCERRVDMSKTVVKDSESIEDALRRFKRDVSRTGTLAEVRKRNNVQTVQTNQKIDNFLQI